MKRYHFRIIHICLLVLVLSLPALSAVYGQGVFQWTKPKRIPNYQVTGRPPLLVADSSGNVHAFNYESESLSPGAIYYRRWNVEQGWSPPTDVILPRLGGGAQTVMGVYIDADSVIHLIYYDGTQEEGDIYYTYAYAAVADRSQSWSSPEIIGPKAGPLASASIIGDDAGKLVVLYGGQQVGIGIYEVQSEDTGKIWSEPRRVSLVKVKDQWPFAIQSEIDSAGRLHAVWSIVNSEGVGVEVHYARHKLDSSGWENQAILARREGMDYSTTWPTILSSGENELIIIYQDSFPATRWMIRSTDSGETWGLPIRLFPEVGEYEKAVLLKDSNQGIHLILGNRTQDPEIHGMWYSRWVGNRWTSLEPILSGPISPTFDPSAPQAVILQGNLLLATWWNNVRRENLTGAWFSYTTLDAPQIPSKTLPVPTNAPTSLPTHLAANTGRNLPTSMPTPTQLPPGSFDPDAGQSANPSIPIFLGVTPVLILLVAFIAIRIRHDRFK